MEVMRKFKNMFASGDAKQDKERDSYEADINKLPDGLDNVTLDSESGEDVRPDVVREEVKLPECFKDRMAFVLYNVLSEKECKKYIKKTEKMGYEMALVNIGGGRQKEMTDVRNSSRCIWDSVEEADVFWQRLKQHIPEFWKGRQVMGLNERLRFLRYHPGEYFKIHMDGEYRRDNGEKSYITVQLYLNEGFKGGSTTFFNYSEKESVEVVPKTGMALIFQHDILHEGSELLRGVKYAVRTDVMYSGQVTNDRVTVPAQHNPDLR